MKRTKKLSIAASLLLAVTVFTSCEKLPVVQEISGSEVVESFINPETGVTYVPCSTALMPVTVGDLYCKFDDDNRFRTIKFEDPLRFICDDTEFTAGVYRASTVPDITIKNFHPVAAHVYKEKNVAIFMGQLNAEKQYLSESLQDLINNYSEGESPVPDDSEYIYAIRDAMSGEPLEGVYPYDGMIDKDSMLHVRLLSAEYPGLTYIVVYYRGLDGNDYLFDYGTKLSYKCPLNVALRLWEYLE